MASTPPRPPRAAKRDKLAAAFDHSPNSLLSAVNSASPEAVEFRETYNNNILAFSSSIRARADSESANNTPNPRPRKKKGNSNTNPHEEEDGNAAGGKPGTAGKDKGSGPEDDPEKGEADAEKGRKKKKKSKAKAKLTPDQIADQRLQQLQAQERVLATPASFVNLVKADFGIADAPDKAAREDAALTWLSCGFTSFDLMSKSEIQRQWRAQITGELGLVQTVGSVVAAVPACPVKPAVDNSDPQHETAMIQYLVDNTLASNVQETTAKGTALALHALQATTAITYSIAWEMQTQAIRGRVLLKLYRMEIGSQPEFLLLKTADDNTFETFINQDENRKQAFAEWKKPHFLRAMGTKRLTNLFMMFGPGLLLDKRFSWASLTSASPKYATVVERFYDSLDKKSKTDAEVYHTFCINRCAVLGIAEGLDPALAVHIKSFLNRVVCMDLERGRKEQARLAQQT
uniref:Uncharacterized protein n=1 Tax=Mycena chlorophos TaxID=658473 RepID=A0ABQ0L0C3_MYCCL|nr:predicted protein [Mycena chlorophos]